MRVPLSWLADFVELPPAGELAERLTVAGLEVTAAEAAGVPMPAGLGANASPGLVWARDKIVVACVESVEKHPQADKLKMVTVQYGSAAPKTIITGAPNVAPGDSGQLVIVGLNGSEYYTTDKAGSKTVATLVPKALRGIENDAMCMSDAELGLSDDHDGIIILDPGEARPGTPAADLLGEIVLEIDVLPNMARCLGLVGVAREVSALTGKPLRVPDLMMRAGGGESPVTITVPDPVLCPRYTATLIQLPAGLRTPRVMKSRLRAMNQSPISFAVDVSNYVMFETGQPTHAFDYDALLQRAGGVKPNIVIRLANAGETLVTLDGVERKLTPETLVIADAAGPVALAGVMGGRDTEVTAETRRILLESATFDPVSVRRAARQFNLHSEASGRFGKGVHPASAFDGARRVLFHLTAGTGAEVVGRLVDHYPKPRVEPVIDLTRDEIERVLGEGLPDELVLSTLSSLGFSIQETSWGWRVTPPAGRLDIQSGPADLIEEVARIVGYDRLPGRLLPFELPTPKADPAAELEDVARDALTRLRFDEAITYSLSSEERHALLTPPGREPTPGEFVKLLNPPSPGRAAMRRSLLPELLAVAARNLKTDPPRVALFEAGRVYLPRAGELLPDEPSRLAVVLAGGDAAATWAATATPRHYDFYDLKGAVEGLFAALDLTPEFAPVAESHLHPGRSASVSVGGVPLGTLGELHPQVARAFDFPSPPVVAEFDLALMLAALPARVPFRRVSPFERQLRDVAAVVPEATPAALVEAEIRAAAGDILESATPFDVYRGDSIPAGTKSLAYALCYRAADRALTPREVDAAHKKVEGRLRHVLKATIRGQD